MGSPTPGPGSPTSGQNQPDQMPDGSFGSGIYTYPGLYTYTVPEGVTSVRMDVWGGMGLPGLGNNATTSGGGVGPGDYVGGVWPVTPGQVLIFGGATGGYPGRGIKLWGPGENAADGGTGGSSYGCFADEFDLNTLMNVAGGGGGGGGGGSGTGGPNGFGDGGQGGAGGGLTPTTPGGQGTGTPDNTGTAGQPGVGTTNGQGGAGKSDTAGFPAQPGSGLYGGNGGWNYNGTDNYHSSGGGGGGGGAGYPNGAGGGGGGAGEPSTNVDGGGGGGGSGGCSYASREVESLLFAQGVNYGQACLMLTPAPPDAPTITGPTSGSVADLASGFNLSWDYSSSIGAALAGFVYRRRRVGTAVWQYATFQSGTVVWGTAFAANYANQPTVGFPPGVFSAGVAYEMQLACFDQRRAFGPFSSTAVVESQRPPQVSITSPTVTNGAVASSRPQVTWQVRFGQGASQIAYRIQVSGDATWDSEWINSQDTSTTLPWIPPNARCTLTVSVAQTGSQTGQAAIAALFSAPTAPPAPAVTATVGAAGYSYGVTVKVATVGGTVVGVVERSYDGEIWSPVRNSPGSLGTVIDLECTPGQPVNYRACLQSADNTARGAFAYTNVVTPTTALNLVLNPLTFQQVAVNMQPGTFTDKLAARQTVYAQEQIGPSVVISDARNPGGPTFKFRFLDSAGLPLAGYAGWAAFEQVALPADGSMPVLLVQHGRLNKQWWVVLGDVDLTHNLAPLLDNLTVSDAQAASTVVAAPAVTADAHL